MTVLVSKVEIPAYSTLGFGEGLTDEGRAVRFAGDHRMMHDLGEAVATGDPIEAEIESWQVIG